MMNKSEVNWSILVGFVGLVGALLFVGFFGFDVWLQNYFFDFSVKKWLVDADEPRARFVFYVFPKILFGVFAFLVLVFLVICFRDKKPQRYRVLLVLLGLIFLPLLVGNVKKFTNIYCPNQLALYNGQYPYFHIFAKYDAAFVEMQKTVSPHGEPQHGKRNRGKCFPAGHAITGFAFVILFFALNGKRQRFLALFGAFVWGWILGFYQMLKGAHFFGHNLVTMFACFLLAALITRIMIEMYPQTFDDKNLR